MFTKDKVYDSNEPVLQTASSAKSIPKKPPKQSVVDEKVFLSPFKSNDFDHLLDDDDVKKLERLQLINASARYELLAANQQLIDFHLNLVMQQPNRKKKDAAEESYVDKKSVLESAATTLYRDERIKYDPHLVMQQRLNEMSPLVFGDTLRLPVFGISRHANFYK